MEAAQGNMFSLRLCGHLYMLFHGLLKQTDRLTDRQIDTAHVQKLLALYWADYGLYW